VVYGGELYGAPAGLRQCFLVPEQVGPAYGSLDSRGRFNSKTSIKSFAPRLRRKLSRTTPRAQRAKREWQIAKNQ
jgi:hypothetical protein